MSSARKLIAPITSPDSAPTATRKRVPAVAAVSRLRLNIATNAISQYRKFCAKWRLSEWLSKPKPEVTKTDRLVLRFFITFFRPPAIIHGLHSPLCSLDLILLYPMCYTEIWKWRGVSPRMGEAGGGVFKIWQGVEIFIAGGMSETLGY